MAGRAQIYTWIIVLLVVGFLATSLASYRVARESLANQMADTTLPLTGDTIYSEIQRDLLRPILVAEQMAFNTFVRDWALTGERDPPRMIAYLSEIQGRHDTISSFFISETTRRYYHPTGILKTVSADDPLDGWYFRAASGPNAYEINVDWDTADRSTLVTFINHKVHDYDGNLLGITGVGLAMESVAEILASYREEYGRDVLFVDHAGTVKVAAQGADIPPSLAAWPALATVADRVLSVPNGSFVAAEDGQSVYVNSRYVPEFGWYLLVVQRGDPAQVRLDRALIIALAAGAGIMAVVIGVVHWSLRGYQRELETMATTDKLTGALNRQAFETIFAQQHRLAQRRDEPLSLILLDIDHFKAVNDRHGHAVGDRAIVQMTQTIRGAIRRSDTLCRWGGEEFLILLPDCPLERAAALAEKIRLKAAAAPAPIARLKAPTVSLGVTEVRRDDSETSAIQRADAALYVAKRGGRNRVALPPEETGVGGAAVGA